MSNKFDKPFSEACEQNKLVIRNVISSYLQDKHSVLEIGSGTGQHAVYLAANFPQLVWQTSDLPANLAAIQAWIGDSGLSNLPDPLELDVCMQWPVQTFELIFSANTFHIMSTTQVERCLAQCGLCLDPNGYLIVYGPFNYQGRYTSVSNEQFDAWLKARDPQSGIKHFEWVCELAEMNGFRLIHDITMPANNRILIWRNETSIDAC